MKFKVLLFAALFMVVVAVDLRAQSLGNVVADTVFRIQGDHDCLNTSLYRNKVDGKSAGDTVMGQVCGGGVVTLQFNGIPRGQHTIAVCAVNDDGFEACSPDYVITATSPLPNAPKNLRMTMTARLEINLDRQGRVRSADLSRVRLTLLNTFTLARNEPVTATIESVQFDRITVDR